jgi:hypothetical protein
LLAVIPCVPPGQGPVPHDTDTAERAVSTLACSGAAARGRAGLCSRMRLGAR